MRPATAARGRVLSPGSPAGRMERADQALFQGEDNDG